MDESGNLCPFAVFHSIMRAGVTALLLGGCTRAVAPAAAPEAPPVPAVAPEAASASPPPARALPSNRCWTDAPPKPRAAPKVYAGDTCADHRRAEASLAKKLAKQYDRTVTGSVVDVTFACDPLTSEVEELVVETGSGHGGGLEIWRARRKSGEADFEILGLGNHGYYSPASKGQAPVRIARGKISAAALDKALGTARPALTVQLRELEPPPPPNGMWGRSFSTSSGNFHLAFRLSDGTHQLARRFTGYPGSSDQPRYLGLQAAWAAVGPLFEKLPLEPGEATADERDFFVISFLRAAPRFDDDFAWWVRDRYVALAEHLGSRELVAALLGVLDSGLREGEAQTTDDRRREVAMRRLEQPLATLARLTGWDPRKDDAGKERDPVAVAKEVIAECAVR